MVEETLSWLSRGNLSFGGWGYCSQGGAIPWNLMQSHHRSVRGSGSQSGSLASGTPLWEGVERTSSSWALLVALCCQIWELGKLPSTGARCKKGCTSQDTGSWKRIFLSPSVSLQQALLAQHHSKWHRWDIYTAHLQGHSAGEEGWIWKCQAISCWPAQNPLSYVFLQAVSYLFISWQCLLKSRCFLFFLRFVFIY